MSPKVFTQAEEAHIDVIEKLKKSSGIRRRELCWEEGRRESPARVYDSWAGVK